LHSGFAPTLNQKLKINSLLVYKSSFQINYLKTAIMTQEKRNYKKGETAAEVRKKATALEESRDHWKTRNRESQEDLKNLKKRMNEVRVSREGWELKYLRASEEARVYREMTSELEEELNKERVANHILAERLEKLVDSKDIKKKL